MSDAVATDIPAPAPAELSVLIVEDDQALRRSIELNLQNAGYAVRIAEDAIQALAILSGEDFEIILCDLRMPGMDGISFIRRCRETGVKGAIIMMTAFASQDLVLEAIRAGAYDYLLKPFAAEELIMMMRKIAEREQLQKENEALRSQITQRYNFSSIVAQSDAMREIFETVKRLASFNTTVLITGESGTGKELLARAIHHNSPRRGCPFVAINCGAIPETLMESELFGHRKGAFTDATRDKKGLFEEATGGTLFLDEIGELPLHLQVKILRALQEQEIRRVGDEVPIAIDVRIIAATLRNLEDDVTSGRFRDDLYYRLNVVSIHIPPLRERPEDIEILAHNFIKKHSRRLGLEAKELAPDALRCLMEYSWKGNVRELENCIERALVLSDEVQIVPEALPPHIGGANAKASEALPFVDDGNLSIKQKTRELEIALIQRALKVTNGNRTRAAKILEISHRALLYKLKEYQLGDRDDAKDEAADD